MNFLQFAEAHGLIIESLVTGRWVRSKTTDKSRKRNGAYKYLGDVGFVQNHRTMDSVAVWRPDGPVQHIDRSAMREQQRIQREKQEHRYADAQIIAADMIKRAGQMKHPYLARKGFPDEFVWVLEGELLVPMRDFKTNALNSLQRITEDGQKRFLPCGKAKGSVLKLGHHLAPERWLCEGYATGLSVREAIRSMHRQALVIVCFSAGNLTYIAEQVKRPAFVVADCDTSKTGEQAAIATGLPWVMPPDLDSDANDLHQRQGLRALVRLMLDLRAG